MRRLHQALLIGTFLPICWLGLQAVHELGHVAAALATGAKVTTVVLHPLTISRTDTWGGSHPRLVIWAGPLVGSLLPLLVLVVYRALRGPGGYLLQFFAGSCLIANGAYLLGGSFVPGCDADDLLRRGAAAWPMWLFAAWAIPLGLYLWNGLGPSFGLGRARGTVDHRVAYFSGAALIITVILEIALSSH
jgi:hypothetical protein